MTAKPVVPLHDFRAQYESIRAEVALALASVMERQDFVLGREVAELEEQMAQVCGVPNAVACGNGSDALLLALMALDVRADDAVLVPAFTFFATAGAVARLGARPVFADIDPETFNISADTVERALARYPGVKAAIPVDLYGQIPDWEAIRARLPEAVPLIEDAAQAILAEHGGHRAGSLGRIGAFSFFPSKNLGAFGDGGMAVTADAALAQRIRRLRVHGSKDRYYHDEVGFNSRLDTLQAAVLLVKLRHLEDWTRARICAAERYTRLFAERGLSCSGAVYPSKENPVATPRGPSPDSGSRPRARHVFHQYTVRVLDRDRLHQALEEEGISTAIYYPLPLHLQKCFAPLGGKPGDCPEAERAAAEVLSLPVFAEIDENQQQRVVDTISRFFGR